jgi:hypothetical protein
MPGKTLKKTMKKNLKGGNKKDSRKCKIGTHRNKITKRCRCTKVCKTI